MPNLNSLMRLLLRTPRYMNSVIILRCCPPEAYTAHTQHKTGYYLWWYSTRYPCRMHANMKLGNPPGYPWWPRRHRRGLRRLHEGAYAVALVVRALYCVPTFNVKQHEVLFECVRIFFSWHKKTSGYQSVSIFKMFWASRQLYKTDRCIYKINKKNPLLLYTSRSPRWSSGYPPMLL